METLQRTANRGSISTGNYEIDNSLKFEADNTEFIENASTNSTQGNRQKGTASVWVKRTERTPDNSATMLWATGHANGNSSSRVYFDGHTSNAYGQDGLQMYLYQFGAGGGDKWIGYPDMKFRDFSAWYHIVIAIDTTQAVEANRVKLYVNGAQQTINIQSMVSQNSSCSFNDDGKSFRVGGMQNTTNYTYNGYMSEFVWVDNAQLAPTDFGEVDEDTGIWKPIDVSGLTFGTQGFYLKFDDSSALGADSSGNSNNLGTLNNISAADQATDTPTNNFATLNQLQLDGSVINNSATITEGATKATAKEFDIYNTFAPTFGVTSGKWYAEFEYEGSNVDNFVGILDIDAVVPYNSRLGKAGQWSVGLYQSTGTLFVTSDSGVTTTANWGATAADGDIMSVAVDMDNYFVYIAKNGTWQNSGNPTSGANGTGGKAFDSNKTVGIGCSAYGYNSNGIIFTNFGGYTAGTISSAASDANGYGTFEYAPPSGYYALCTKNLAEYG